MNETVALLAARAPQLRTAIRDAKKAGYAYVVVDGTLIPVDRVAADGPFYSAQDLAYPPQAPLLPWRAGQLAKAIHVLQIREA